MDRLHSVLWVKLSDQTAGFPSGTSASGHESPAGVVHPLEKRGYFQCGFFYAPKSSRGGLPQVPRPRLFDAQNAVEQHCFSGYFRMTILSMYCTLFHFSWRTGNPGPCAPGRSLQRAAADTGKGHFDNREEVLIRLLFRSISTNERILFLRLGLWRQTARRCWR